MHLTSYQINRHHYAGLAPAELLTIDDHLVTCGFCRQQLRAGLNWQTAIQNLQTNLRRIPESDCHVSTEQSTALICNRLTAVERELVTSHLQICSSCATQVQFQTIDSVASRTIRPDRWARLKTFLQDRAALIWPLPVAAFIVVMLVTIADSFYLRHVAKTKSATIIQSGTSTPTRKFDALPQASKIPQPSPVR